VVVGAAVHASALAAGDRILSASSLAERLPREVPGGHAIGLAVAGGRTEPVILASQRPPVTARRLFGTNRHGQRACCFEILEGSSPITADNERIGGVVLDGLPPLPAGAADIDVYFELSATGSLTVTVQDRASGRSIRKAFQLRG
jgi:molecular chaperone DnaK (HSP70)